MRTTVEIKSAMIAYIKSLPTVVSLLNNDPSRIKEAEWQGTDFAYPGIRVGVDLRPSINGCGPDTADWTIEAFSEQKSSLEADTITGTLAVLLHKKPFISNQIKFSTVVVKEVVRADASIYGWRSQLFLTTQMN